MIDTTFLHPPSVGLRSDPVLFGIAEGLTALFPVIDRPRQDAGAASSSDDDERAERDATFHAAS